MDTPDDSWLETPYWQQRINAAVDALRDGHSTVYMNVEEFLAALEEE